MNYINKIKHNILYSCQLIKVQYIVLFLLLFSFSSVNATITNIWSIPNTPYYSFLVWEEIRYLVPNPDNWSIIVYNQSWDIVDSAWTLSSYYFVNTNSSWISITHNNFIIETENSIFFIFRYFTLSTWWYVNYKSDWSIIKYNKSTDSFIQPLLLVNWYTNSITWCITWTNPIRVACQLYDIKILIEGEKLIFAMENKTKYYIDINDVSDSLTMNAYTWSTLYSSMELTNNNYYYRGSLNNLNYLDTNNKTYNYILIDSVWDIIRINDVFVSTFDFTWYNMIYNDWIFYFSIYGKIDDEVRGYYNYELWSANYLDRYYLREYNNKIYYIHNKESMGYDFLYWNYQPFINWVDLGAWLTPYWIWTDLNLYKDSDIDLSWYLVDIPWATGTWEIDNSSIEAIFDTDLNGDGETSIVEALKSVFLIPYRIIIEAWNYILQLKAIVDQLLDYDEPVYRNILNFNLIPKTNAWFFTELAVKLSDRQDEESNAEPQDQSFIYKYYNMLLYWLYFFIMILLLWLYLNYKNKW